MSDETQFENKTQLERQFPLRSDVEPSVAVEGRVDPHVHIPTHKHTPHGTEHTIHVLLTRIRRRPCGGWRK